MRHYDLEITLLTGEISYGQARTTRVSQQEEFLIVEKDDTEHEIRLDKIKSITIINSGAEFSTIKVN